MLIPAMARGISQHLRILEAIFKALANRRRLLMLSTLGRHREIHVGGLAEELRLPVKTVSRNLRLLERAGMLLSDPRRGYVFYRLNPDVPPWCRTVLDAAEAAKDT